MLEVLQCSAAQCQNTVIDKFFEIDFFKGWREAFIVLMQSCIEKLDLYFIFFCELLIRVNLVNAFIFQFDKFNTSVKVFVYEIFSASFNTLASIFEDFKNKNSDIKYSKKVYRQTLRSMNISFRHPLSDECLLFKEEEKTHSIFNEPMPDDFIIRYITQKSKANSVI